MEILPPHLRSTKYFKKNNNNKNNKIKKCSIPRAGPTAAISIMNGRDFDEHVDVDMRAQTRIGSQSKGKSERERKRRLPITCR